MGKVRHDKTKKKPENQIKKELLEKIAAELHEMPGVKIETNAWLPSLINPEDEREIDVLLTTSPLGYSVRYAIECRNVAKPMEAADIGAFVDKLNQVGVSVRGSIFVSSGGYRSGAVTRANESGIILLKPEGLTRDRLSLAIDEAVQSIVFLLPQLVEVSWQDNFIDYRTVSEEETHNLYDESDNLYGNLIDIIWEQWYYEGVPPSMLGEHTINLSLPSGLHHKVQGKQVPILGASAKVLVIGIVASISGKMHRVALRNATTDRVEKFRLEASFNTNESRYPLSSFLSEEELDAFLSQSRPFHLISERIRLPKVLTHMCFWPPSNRAFNKMLAKMQPFILGKAPDPRPLNYREIEGDNLMAAVEPPLESYPAVHRNRKRKPFYDPILEQEYHRLIKAMKFIEEKTNTPISLPIRPVTQEEVRRVYETAIAIKKGRLTLSRFTIPMTVGQARGILKDYPDGILKNWQYKAKAQINLFGAYVPLGEIIVSCRETRIPPDEVEKAKKMMRGKKGQLRIDLNVLPHQPYTINVLYTQWAPKGRN
jgi:hypothetical protein